MVLGEVCQCTLAIRLARPIKRVAAENPLNASLLWLALAALNQLHHDDSRKSQRGRPESLKPRHGRRMAAENIDSDVRVEQRHALWLRVCACARRRRANSLLSPISARSAQIPTRPDCRRLAAVMRGFSAPAADTTGSNVTWKYLSALA